jgi:hypothetical protein
MSRPKTKKRASKRIKSRSKRPIFAYPIFIFILLCTGVFLVAWTLRAGADDIFVAAKVSAPLVTQPAVINTPTQGAHVSSVPITVAGTCPPNAGYIEIFDNNLMRGTAICGAGGTFSLAIDLFPGDNSLVAHGFNITDDEGPQSAQVNLVYNAQQPPGNPAGNPAINTPSAASILTVKTQFVYKGYNPGDKVEWPLDISGGTAPYAVSIDWDDGNSDLISRPKSGEFKISHVYSQPGGYKGSYTIKAKISDAAGQSAFIQFFVIVAAKPVAATGSIFSKPPPGIGGGLNWLWVAWPAYAVIVLMSLSYILGEREELIILRKKGVLRR